jgi:hypothetical protein
MRGILQRRREASSDGRLKGPSSPRTRDMCSGTRMVGARAGRRYYSHIPWYGSVKSLEPARVSPNTVASRGERL